jgi:TIR domain
MSKPAVFVSYSHKDEKWKDRLMEHLNVLREEGDLDPWDDRRIQIGDAWQQEIAKALTSARAAILLISRSFLNSKFIRSVEVLTILERTISNGMKVFPVIVSSCPWQEVVWLNKFQARPTDGKSLARLRGDKIDEVLSSIAIEVKEILASFIAHGK